MKEKFRLICIPIIILSIITFLTGTILGAEYDFEVYLIGGSLMIISIIFTIIAMLTSPFVSIGAIVVNSVCNLFLGYFGVFATVASALSIIYVCYGVCQKYSISKVAPTQFVATSSAPNNTNNMAVTNNTNNMTATNNTPNLSKLMDFSQELQQFKYLLDNGILTEEEFAEQKAKIMRKYGVATANKAPKNIAINIVGTPQIAIDGDYDMGALVLTLLGRSFAFKSKETQTVAMRGSFIFDKNTRSLTLFKTDNTMIKMSVNQDGNLVSPNGTVYTKIH